MKITGVELRRVGLPLVAPFETSFGSQTDRDILLLRVVTTDGDVLGVKGFGGDASEEALYIAVDTLGFAFAWGEMDGPGNYGSGVKTPVGLKDLFLVKAGF